jgi:hypothetical protein
MFTILLSLFRCKVIHNINHFSCLEYFVLVHESSAIVKHFNKKVSFCYWIDQKQTMLLMRFVDVWTIVQKHLLPELKLQAG